MTAEDAPPRHAVTQVLTSTDAAGHAAATEVIVEEAVAIVFNGTTAAVMMATPGDVADLAHGFALTEGYIAGAGDIESYEEVRHDEGVEARFWVGPERANALEARRRSMAGPVGCGLCGIDSLQQVRRPLGAVNARLTLTPEQITGAMAALSGWQPLKQRTRSTHAAAFFVPGQGITLAREDVGRHNA
ncbi:MAG: formate dehydrogenase accessory sulfurtransferase FdhD, partial [Pseudomonadota bacterium]